MANAKLPKRLFKSSERVSSYASTQSGVKLMRRMARDHFDVLQNLEFVFARRHREQGDIDDSMVRAAIHACLNNTTPDDPIVSELVDELNHMRSLRPEVSDAVWRDAFAVIDTSVKGHSDLTPGEKSYLSFIKQFIR